MHRREEGNIDFIIAPTWLFGELGIAVGALLCMLQGFGVIDIGWFWAVFPFWICPAIGGALIVSILVITWIIFLIMLIVEKVKGLKKRP